MVESLSEITLPPVECTWRDVLDLDNDATFIRLDDWTCPVQFFVGRNGSGKTRTASVVARKLSSQIGYGNATGVRLLATDRLASFQTAGHYGGGLMGASGEFPGIPLDTEGVNAAHRLTTEQGSGADSLYVLRDFPDCRLRISTLLSAGFGRQLEFLERSGRIDPELSIDGKPYSLFRREGHGLKQLIVLLATVYRPDWSLLIVDEPELHLHPSLTQLWLSELLAECAQRNRRAIIVTHEPRIISPRTGKDLAGIWVFQPGQCPLRVRDQVLDVQVTAVEADLKQNPLLLSTLVFSPRPVLVEGERDEASFNSAFARLLPPGAAMQSDPLRCGGGSGVARWFEIATKLGLDARAVCDLDVLFDSGMIRTMDSRCDVRSAYQDQWQVDRTTEVLRPIYDAMRDAQVSPDPASRRVWLAGVLSDEDALNTNVRLRIRKLLTIWKDAGTWLHSEGDLEGALGLSLKADVPTCRAAASIPSALDHAAQWAGFSMELSGRLLLLLQAEVERIAHTIQIALLLNKDLQTSVPLGSSSDADRQLVEVFPEGEGRHRLRVILPSMYSGWWVAFDRSTASSDLILKAPGE